MTGKLLRFFLSTGDAPVETPGVPGEAAPTPVAPSVPTAPPPAAPPADPGALFSDVPPEEAVPEGALYRDVTGIRSEIARARSEYGPIHQALGNLPAEEREALVTFAPATGLVRSDPNLGPDLAFLQGAYPTLGEADRETVKAIIADARFNPAEAAQALAQAAQILRGDTPTTPGGQEGFDELGYALDDPNRPLTVAEWETRTQEMLANAQQEAELERATQEAQTRFLQQARDLGYRPDSTGDPSQDLINQAQVRTLFDVAQRLPAGTADPIATAHQLLAARDQQVIDQYADGKLATSRPGITGAGAPPSGERVLETLDDMDRAAAERTRQVANRPRG